LRSAFSFKPSVVPIDYRCDDESFWAFALDCQLPTPTSEKLRLGLKCWFTDSTITDVSMRQEYTNSSMAWRIEFYKSSFAQISTKNRWFQRSWTQNWQSSLNRLFWVPDFLGEEVVLKG
jgi:hypothetical protein